MLIWAIRLVSLVPVSAGMAGILTGPGFLALDLGPSGADSHVRYLSGLLLGIGFGCIWCTLDPGRRGGVFQALCAIVVLGGVARALGVVVQGVPPTAHLVALGIECGVVPLLWLWWRAGVGR